MGQFGNLSHDRLRIKTLIRNLFSQSATSFLCSSHPLEFRCQASFEKLSSHSRSETVLLVPALDDKDSFGTSDECQDLLVDGIDGDLVDDTDSWESLVGVMPVYCIYDSVAGRKITSISQCTDAENSCGRDLTYSNSPMVTTQPTTDEGSVTPRTISSLPGVKT
jgi:hypothetical protein